MDGYELAGALRAQFDGEVRLIALSGYGLVEDMRRSSAAGFEAHLVKPVDPIRLAALLALKPRARSRMQRPERGRAQHRARTAFRRRPQRRAAAS